MKILIVGLGSIGQRHTKNLIQLGVEEIGFLRREPTPYLDNPDLPVFTDIEAALGWGPEVAVISGPTSMHISSAKVFTGHGVHLFLEKPLSHNWAGVPELIRIVREKQIQVMVGFDLRFHPSLLRAKSIIDEGTLGRIIGAQVQVGQWLPDWHPWEDYRYGVSAKAESGGGVLRDLVHELDYITWLLGPVERVACQLSHQSSLEIETEDIAQCLFTFQSGTKATLHLDYIQRVATRSCRLIGEEASLEWDGIASKVRLLSPGGKSAEEWSFDADRNVRYLAEMEALLSMVRDGAPPPVGLESAARTLLLEITARRAAKEEKFLPIPNLEDLL